MGSEPFDLDAVLARQQQEEPFDLDAELERLAKKRSVAETYPAPKPRPQYKREEIPLLQRILSALPAKVQEFSSERLASAPEDLKNLGIGAAKGIGQLAVGAGETVRHVGQKQEELLPGSSKVVPFSPGAYADIGRQVAELTGEAPPEAPPDQSLSQRIRGSQETLGVNPEGTAQEIGAGIARAAPALATGGGGLVPQMVGGATQMAGLATLEGATPGEAAGVGAFGAAGPALGKLAGKVGKKLSYKAVEQYRKALHPTTRATKQEAERIIPELLRRRVSGNLETLGALGESESATVGRQIGRSYREATRAGKTLDPVKIADELEQFKAPFVGDAASQQAAFQAAGNDPTKLALAMQGKVILNDQAVQKISEIQDLLRTVKPDPDNLWKFRKNLDNIVKASNGFSRPLPPQVGASIAKDARAVFQKELTKAVPDVEALNREYQLWQSLEHVASETSQRKIGQQGARGMLARGSGLVAGGVLGGIPGAVAGPELAAGISGFVTSPRWRTVSAVQKARLADFLAHGDTQGAIAFLTKVMGQQVAGPRDYATEVESARRRHSLGGALGQ